MGWDMTRQSEFIKIIVSTKPILLILFLFQLLVLNGVAFSKDLSNQPVLVWHNLGKNIGCASFTIKVHDSLPPYIITIRGKIYKQSEDEYFTPKKFEIKNKSTGKIIQKINASWVNSNSTSCDYVQIVDMNFDGYLDFRFFIDKGATGNDWYGSFLYDPKTHKFILNELLSDQSGLTVDAKNKQVVTYTTCGGCLEFMKYYKYQNGHYIFTKIEWTDMDRTKEPGCFKITGIPKVKDIEVTLERSCDPEFSDYIKKQVKVFKIEGLRGGLDKQ